jgi:serine/threonine protein kinase/WD40 repeat protein/Flp pilus assembly protein TadD
LAQVQHLDAVCRRFEQAWKAAASPSRRPRIADYLGDTPEPERSALLQELIGLEIAYRRRAGETPQLEAYRVQFPSLDAAALAAASGTPAPTVLRAASPPAAKVPEIPGYEVVAELGRGGMGVVYQAWQIDLHRLVALKMVLAGAHASAEELARFRTEAEAVARLQHPHIVQIYDIGQRDRHPYMALEYVEGGSLAQQLQENLLPVRQAAQWLATLARAVHYAHQHGIVHRDLKPANILLQSISTTENTEAHREGAAAGIPLCSSVSSVVRDFLPKITDFGLAKLLVGGGPTLTHSGVLLGTPGYMAPEQAAGKSKEIGPAVDIYSLGAILYELLTGRPPFKAETPQETLAQVQAQEPVSPSRLRPKLPRDLTTICLKCLEKEPGKRYATAEALAEDLDRFLAGKPIQARPVGNTERLWRWCRRNPMVATLTAAIMLLLVALTVGALVNNVQLSAALRDRSAALADSEEANRKANARLWESYRDQARAMRMSRHPGQRVESLRSIQEAMKLPVPPGHALDELRTEAIAALALPDLEVLHEWEGFPAGSIDLDFDAKLERYARLATDGTVSVRRVSDDAEIARWQERTEGPWPHDESSLRFSPDGRFLCIRHSASGRLIVRRLDGSKAIICHECTEGDKVQGGWAMDFSPDSNRLAYLLTDSRIAIVDLTSGQTRFLKSTAVGQSFIQFAPDGRRFALNVHRGEKWVLEVRDAATGQVQQSLLHPMPPNHSAWHPDGQTLATCCNDLLIRLWDVPSGQLLRKLEGHKTVGIYCAFTRTGDRLLSNDWTGVLRVWEPSSGRQLLSFPAGGVLRISADDRVSATDAANHTKLQVLRLSRGLEYRTIALGGSKPSRVIDGRGLVVHPNGRLLACLATDQSLSLVDLVAGREVANLLSSEEWPFLWQPSGDLLTAGAFGFLRWPVRADTNGAESYRFGPPEPLLPGFSGREGCAASADMQTIAVPDYDRGGVVLHRGRPVRRVGLHPQQDVRSCALSPDGHWVATGSHSNTDGLGAKIWEAATGKLVKELHVPGLCRVAFTPDGRWLLTTGGGCRLWEVGSWNEGPKIGKPEGCFSPDGRLLAVEDSPGAIRLVRAENGAELARLEAPEQTRLAPRCFTPDGAQLIAVGVDTRALHVWDLRAVRQGLAAVGLDFKAPTYPAAKGGQPVLPLQVQVDLGKDFERIPGGDLTRVGLYSFLLALRPFDFEAYLQRGRQYAGLGESQKAIDDYSMSLLLMPQDYAHRATVLYWRAGLFRRLRDFARAQADLEQVIGLVPDDAVPCNNLAWLYVNGPEKLRNLPRGLALAKKAVELSSGQWMYPTTLGAAYYRLGQFEQAIDSLERSLQESQGESAAYDLFFLAMCHARRGEVAEAKDCYGRAVHWVQEQQGKLQPGWKEELDGFRAEAEALLREQSKSGVQSQQSGVSRQAP